VVSELGGAQMSTLLESLPGIANVLRSPVADALVNVIRSAAGLEEFAREDAEELVHYATRRGLLDPDEGDRVLADVAQARRQKAAAKRAAGKKAPRPRAKAKGKGKPKAKSGKSGKTKSSKKVSRTRKK